MTTNFLYSKIVVSTLIFLYFSSQVKIRYLRQPLVRFVQQLNKCSENDLVLKLFDDFLAIHYASVKQMHLAGLFGCHDRQAPLYCRYLALKLIK